ncbi:hypothetical protein KFU94_00915 [Chloroflexi bacterium TSY]|nr:hypothetical protein [Chloroflexi bacterium TSY]
MPYPLQSETVSALVETDLFKVPFLRIPVTWYETIVYPNGKPYLNAITLLADVVSFYMPIIVDDDGQVDVVQQRFATDILQRSYKQIEARYGLTKKQSRDAYNHLQELGVISLVFRSVEVEGEKKLWNVMFIDLHLEQLKALTFSPLHRGSDIEVTTPGDIEVITPNDIEVTTPGDIEVTTPNDIEVTRGSDIEVITYTNDPIYTNDPPCTNNLNTNDPFAAAAGSFAPASSSLVSENGSTCDHRSRVVRLAESGDASANSATDELVHWSAMNESFRRDVVEGYAVERMMMVDWRAPEVYVASLSSKQLIHLLLWLVYCDRNYESMSANLDGDIRSIPGYIRSVVDIAPLNVAGIDKEKLIDDLRRLSDSQHR